VFIAEDISSPYGDYCLLYAGDKLFARHPYKFFVTFKGRSPGASFFVEFSYAKSQDLGPTSNRQQNRCFRMKNRASYSGSDDKKGSTVGGKCGYGVPLDLAKDGQQGKGCPSSGGGSSSGGGGSKPTTPTR